MNCAQALVKMLENLGVTHVFGIPGAKIDSVFIALLESKIQLVVCRHEQNAAFMAGAIGRMTGKVGVCLVTSGPGVGNLTTGLVTATSEATPVLAIGGEVPLTDRLKQTHQSLDGVNVLRPVTKYAAEVVTPEELGEILGNAVRAAESGRPGAAFISLPKNVALAQYPGDQLARWGQPITQGPGAAAEIHKAAERINASRRPVVLLGMQASDPRHAEAVRNFLESTSFPYTATFQGPGAWVGKNRSNFLGRVGIFNNQPADRVLQASDCVIAVSYAPAEYDAALWNTQRSGSLISVDVIASDQDRNFLADTELIGDIGASLDALTPLLRRNDDEAYHQEAREVQRQLAAIVASGASRDAMPVHPLRIIHELSKVVTDQTTVALDIGSLYIWMDRYFPAAYPRQFLVSNGQQTLGVGLPWAMAANLARPDTPVISISGDGGFLFSAMELETAKRIGSRFVHVIWDSGSYDMVAFQEEAAYQGRTAGITLGRIDIVSLAAGFGCKGVQIQHPDEIEAALREGLASPVPFLINIPVDYSDNLDLMKSMHQQIVN